MNLVELAEALLAPQFVRFAYRMTPAEKAEFARWLRDQGESYQSPEDTQSPEEAVQVGQELADAFKRAAKSFVAFKEATNDFVAIARLAPSNDAWRPIATAPKDGTKVLLRITFERHGFDPMVVIGSWNSDSSSVNPRPYWEYNRHMNKIDIRIRQPDAWMPLPSAHLPIAEGGAE